MRVVVVGVGCIGSVVAAHFARAQHEVTLVARGERGRSLLRDGLRVRDGRDQVFSLPIAKDLASAQGDLLIVCVQMQQVCELLPALARHPASRVCFLLNAHPVPASWADALGERLILGFPAMLAGYRDHAVTYTTLPRWLRFVMISTLGPARGHDGSRARDTVRLFNRVGLATTYSRDMESWLASHSALVTGLMGLANQRQSSLRMAWHDALCVARALHESLDVVRASGATLTPANVLALRFTPTPAIASVFWSLSRMPWFERAVFDYAHHARDEVRTMYAGLHRHGATPNLDRLCADGAAPRERLHDHRTPLG